MGDKSLPEPILMKMSDVTRIFNGLYPNKMSTLQKKQLQDFQYRIGNIYMI